MLASYHRTIVPSYRHSSYRTMCEIHGGRLLGQQKTFCIGVIFERNLPQNQGKNQDGFVKISHIGLIKQG